MDAQRTMNTCGCALQLVTVRTTTSGVSCGMNNDAWDKLLANFDSAAAPLRVVTLFGRARTGKSTLLLLALRELYEKNGRGASLDGLPREDVFQAGDADDIVTEGVWCWSHPIVHPTLGGSMLLIDTEGTDRGDDEVTARVSAIAAFLASRIVYHTRGGILESDLEAIGRVCTALRWAQMHAQSVAETADDGPTRAAATQDMGDEVNPEVAKTFQNLALLASKEKRRRKLTIGDPAAGLRELVVVSSACSRRFVADLENRGGPTAVLSRKLNLSKKGTAGNGSSSAESCLGELIRSGFGNRISYEVCRGIDYDSEALHDELIQQGEAAFPKIDLKDGSPFCTDLEHLIERIFLSEIPVRVPSSGITIRSAVAHLYKQVEVFISSPLSDNTRSLAGGGAAQRALGTVSANFSRAEQCADEASLREQRERDHRDAVRSALNSKIAQRDSQNAHLQQIRENIRNEERKKANLR